MWQLNVVLFAIVATSLVPVKSKRYTDEPCGVNEELSECANKNCLNQRCDTRRQPLPCPPVTTCERGCVCKYRYLRDASGTCIPDNECVYKPEDCRENEEYTPCTEKVCRPEYCFERGSIVCGPDDQKNGTCTPDCVCKEGYCRSNRGFCVSLSLFPPFN